MGILKPKNDIPIKYQNEVNEAQIFYVYETIPIQVTVNLIAGLLVSYVLIEIHSLPLVISWFVLLILVLGHRYTLWKNYSSSGSQDKNNSKWGGLLLLNVSLFGLSWVYFFQVFFDPQYPEYNAFMIVVIAGVTAGGFSSLSAFLQSFITFSLIALIPLSLRLFYEGGAVYSVLALLSILFAFVLIVFARKAHRHYQLAMVSHLRYRDISSELEEQRHQIQKSDASKTRFLSSLSHDVRQPLHALHLFTQTLIKKNNDSELSPLVQNISKTSNSVRRFFNQLLEYSRIETKRVNPNYIIFPLGDLLERLFIEYEALALDKQLDFRIVQTSIIVESDQHFLERIIRNLLSNAIQYTDQGRILIGCRRKKHSVIIQILDSGSGIKKELHEKIFHEFYRLNDDDQNHVRGTGLGLSIASGLADLMNTKIRIQSREGLGSCFSIEVPRISYKLIDNEIDYSDSSFLQATVHYYCGNLEDDLIQAIQIWSPKSLILNDVNNLLMMKSGNLDIPDAIILDERLLSDVISLEWVLDKINPGGTRIPLFLLTEKELVNSSMVDTEDQSLHWVKKPIKPTMMRLIIESSIK